MLLDDFARIHQHTDDEELAAFGEDGNNDRNENTEGTPGSTGRECKEASNDEDDCGEEVCEAFSSAAHEVVNVVLRTEQRGDILERGSEGENEDCGNHCAVWADSTCHSVGMCSWT